MMNKSHYEVAAHHVGAPGPHAPYPADNLPLKVQKLAAMLKLEWCNQCDDWHAIGGGTVGPTEVGGLSVGDTSAVGGMDGI